MTVVTIRGQLGAGATEIGKLLAEGMRGQYVDREIIEEVAQQLGRATQEVSQKEEPPGSMVGRIIEALANAQAIGGGPEGAYVPTWDVPLDDTRYLDSLTSVIGELAQKQPVVIRGRGSQFVLRDDPAAYHVLVVAPLEIRVQRTMSERGIDEKSATDEINRADGSRRAFIRKYFGHDLEDPIHYQLVLNTGHLTYEMTARLILDVINATQQGK